MNPLANVATSFDQKEDSTAIDALRGYAILLVISTHVTGHVASLVWPAKRLLLLGTNGVQLFFIASAVTLLMSWHRSQRAALPYRIGKFFVNRFFRIAPLYFLAIVFYWIFNGMAPGDFSMQKLLGTLLFYNAWSPYLIPTVGGWQPVPGGWSIGVEFSFYLLFPLLALAATTMKRTVIFTIIAYAIMLFAAYFGRNLYPEISSTARDQFLFFWPPNQLIIFAIGFLLYRSIKSAKISAWVMQSRVTASGATVALIALILLLQFYGKESLPVVASILPLHVLISAAFACWALFVILKPTSLVVSAVVVMIGKMSFSIYLLHFAALVVANEVLMKIWLLDTTGVMSIPYAALLFASATVIAFVAARVTYRCIELPFMRFAKSLMRPRPGAKDPAQQPAGEASSAVNR